MYLVLYLTVHENCTTLRQRLYDDIYTIYCDTIGTIQIKTERPYLI